MRLLDGSSPASAGLDDELSRVERTIKSDPAAEAILFGDDLPGTIIDRLRQRPGEVGQAIEGWLGIAGYRTVSGYDIADSYALEQPEVLVRTIRNAVREGVDAPNTSPDEELAAIRESLSSNERAGFDDRLSEARAVYRVRDESSLLGLWAQGILRRGLLAAGRRLADRGLLHDAEHVVELTHRELLAALRGETAPSADEVASYVEFRLTYDSDDAPDELGSERSPPSDAESETSVPDPVARMRKGRQAVMQAWNLGHEKAEETSPKTIDGLAASPGTYEGKARIVTEPDNFSAIEDGDVLVAEMTSSAFNVVLPLLGAIVTDKGGMLAHPAIVAREFGIPAVVSCEDATHEINDGDQLVVDGDDGKVRIVE